MSKTAKLIPVLMAGLLYLPRLGGPSYLDAQCTDPDYPASFVSYITESRKPYLLHRPFDRAVRWGIYKMNEVVLGWPDGSRASPEAQRAACVAFLMLGGVSMARLLRTLSVPSAALLGAAWVCHPLLSFGVQYEAQRCVLMAAAFSMLAVNAWILCRWRTAILWLVLALGSKEISVVTLAFMFWMRAPPRYQRFLFWTCLASMSAGLYLGWKHIQMWEEPAKGFSVWDRMLSQPGAMFGYWRSIVLPRPDSMSLERSFEPYMPDLVWILVGMLMLLVATYATARRPWILLAWLAMLPEAGPWLIEPRFDHRAIMPLTWAFVGLGTFLRDRLTSIAATAGAIPLVLCLIFQAQWLPRWDNEIGFMLHSTYVEPSSYRAKQNLGMALIKAKHYDMALVQLDQSLRMNPNNPRAATARGVALVLEGDTARGIEQLMYTVKHDQDAYDWLTYARKQNDHTSSHRGASNRVRR